jgi:xylan 1,4-beta-xylosidase
MKKICIFVTALCMTAVASAQSRTADIRIDAGGRLGPLEIDRFALGQGGLSEEPMWADRAAEIRALKPRLIRLFIQEYFDLLPARGRYHWDTLDESVDLILKTGATPLMCIAFKPRVLFPKIDQDIVEPSSYQEWDALIYELVRHYRQRGSAIRYWEIANEPDIGESGGCPYRFKPDNYTRYYQHTVAAIRRADPGARVGGPALANPNSPILPALLDSCSRGQVPLDFISWHIYSSDPARIRATIESKKELLKKYPGLHAETFLDEWNMSLRDPVQDPRFQPCFIAEVAWQMKSGGLDYSCYYHIRDYHVSFEKFGLFMSPQGNANMAKWWNRTAQFDGLFDFQNRVRPAYFAFKLLSRLTGERLKLESSDNAVHGFATRDETFDTSNVLIWNYSGTPVHARVTIEGASAALMVHPLVLDAAGPSDDENARLRQLPPVRLGDISTSGVDLEPYGVAFWSVERR